MPLFKTIKEFIDHLPVEKISIDRKQMLDSLVEFIRKKADRNEAIRLQFVCTHNSRRSLFSQVWAQALAHHLNLNNVHCYSGGTKETAVNAQVVETLKNTGFRINKLSKGNNPVYAVKYSENEHPVIGFSKKLENSEFNPVSGFAAIMTCSQADAGCPFIPGAKKRIAIPFDDPGEYDGTGKQTAMYKQSSTQIATEMYYVFSQIKPKL